MSKPYREYTPEDIYNLRFEVTTLKKQLEMWKNLTVDNGAVALKYQKQLDQFKQAIEKIKEIAEKGDKEKGNLMRTWWFKEILQICNEVISE